MAKKTRTQAANKTRQRRKPDMGTPIRVLLGCGALAAVAAYSPQVALVMICGMLPTAAALLVDWNESRLATYAIGGLNFAGVFPFLPTLWMSRHGMHGAARALGDLFVLLAMFGSAAMGWLLLALLPLLLDAIHQSAEIREKARRRALQKRLIEEWGPEVIRADDEPDAASPPPRGSLSQTISVAS